MSVEANSNTGAEPEIALDQRMDPRLIRNVFRRSGRAHIPGILTTPCAQQIYRCLSTQTPWQMSVHDDIARDLPIASLDQLASNLRAALIQRIEARAAHGFAYRFANCRIDGHEDDPALKDLYITRFYRFLNSPEFLEFARVATGCPDIDFADAQATLYRAGDFLTCHDDDVAGKNRRVAYVFNFTPTWRVEWGGLLAFPDQFGHLHEAFMPSFNALNLIRVPTLHAVTQVASFALGGRYSITGWLRTRT
jgi:SM-20-related protein